MKVVHILDSAKGTTRYYTTRTDEQGGYGKFKYGRSTSGRRVAIKEIRLVESRVADRESRLGRPKTKPMTLAMVESEASKTALLRGAIDRHLQQQIKDHNGFDPLRHLRGALTSFEVIEIVHMGEKVSLVLSLEAGDLWSLHQSIPIDTRGPLSLSAAAQIFSELTALHASDHVHLDLKMENLFFSASGQVKLCDFGLAQLTRDGVCDEKVQGLVGSNFAPEMLPTYDARDEEQPGRETLSSATDVWSAAATVFEVLKRRVPYPNPLEAILDAEGQTDERATANQFAALELWRQRAIAPDGSLRPGVLSENDPISRWMSHCYALMPDLVTTLVRDALVADPAKRASAAMIAADLERQAQSLKPKRTERVRQFFANAPGEKKIVDIERRLATYATWHEREHRGIFKQVSSMIR